MTVRVLGLESGVTSLEDHRHLVSLFQGLGPSGILERRPGIVPSDGAADLTTASAMQADIAAFVAWIDGTSTAIQGGYPFVSDATETLTFSDGDATDDRIDRVVAQIRDNTYDASGETDGRVVIVEGTPAGTPSPPAIPDSSIPLYRVDVAAGTSAGGGGIDFGAAVTDDREYTAALGGVLVVTAGDASQSDWPASPYEGQVIYSTGDSDMYLWDGSAWVNIAEVGPDTGWTTVSTGSEWSDDLDYRLRRGIVWIAGEISKDGTVSANSEVSIATMPSGARPGVRIETLGNVFLNGIDNQRNTFIVRVEPSGAVSVFVNGDSGSLPNTGNLRFSMSYPA